MGVSQARGERWLIKQRPRAVLFPWSCCPSAPQLVFPRPFESLRHALGASPPESAHGWLRPPPSGRAVVPAGKCRAGWASAGPVGQDVRGPAVGGFELQNTDTPPSGKGGQNPGARCGSCVLSARPSFVGTLRRRCVLRGHLEMSGFLYFCSCLSPSSHPLGSVGLLGPGPAARLLPLQAPGGSRCGAVTCRRGFGKSEYSEGPAPPSCHF